MRLLALLIIFPELYGAVSPVQPTPRLLSVQIQRCPLAVYTNLHEEEEKTSRLVVQSEFDETIRFQTNETGTIQFFVTGPGNLSVQIVTDRDVLTGLVGRVYADPNLGGVVFTKDFKVVSPVQETIIKVIMINGDVKKITRVYASTQSLEPPRPPSSHTSMILTPEEEAAAEALANESGTSKNSTQGADTITPPSVDTPSTPVKNGTQDVTATNSTLKVVVFPSVEDILHGNYSHIDQNGLRLTSINLIRTTKNVTDEYVSKSNVYQTRVSNNERGFIIFYISGKGKKKVSIKSVAVKRDVVKVLKTSGDYVAIPYSAHADRVKLDRLLVKVENDQNEAVYYYVTVRRTTK
ncbi:unnamed protein product [Caenorhabditis sp. 36 PRJEB53466]|nr:unnamed protein product [Caenorhabditis sp. 36 PRJEB53466]